jgi:hypothetical protein
MAPGRKSQDRSLEKVHRAERRRQLDAALMKKGREADCFPVGLALVAENISQRCGSPWCEQ